LHQSHRRSVHDIHRIVSNLSRIQKLIALAGSANEHEARSAAYLACKLIREGSYRVVEAASDTPDPWSTFQEAAYRAAAAQQQSARRAERGPPPDTRPRRRVPCEVTRARRSGRCAVCDEPFEEGSDIAVPIMADDARLGSAHADCRSRWTTLA
jgi:hypothetical protein